MNAAKHLTRGRIELGGVVLAIVIGGGLAVGQVSASRTADAAPAPVAGEPYFDRGWEVDNATTQDAPIHGAPTWDHGWEVDNAYGAFGAWGQ